MSSIRILPEELQQKAQPPIPLRPLDAPKAPLINPMAVFDVRTPEALKKEVEAAKKVADFFRNHWLWFYIAAGLAFYRGITATRVNAAIFRIDKALSEKKIEKNPKRKKRK